jgi:hypothetical protein
MIVRATSITITGAPHAYTIGTRKLSAESSHSSVTVPSRATRYGPW